MLYIFHVDTGTMMTFDMNLALESVVQLKEMIERSCRIPADKQVLLVSGGESLELNARVCSYAAGTDTNPIYLFSKNTIESLTPPSPSVDYGSDHDLKEQVEVSQNLPSTYHTVVARAQLAQQFCELSRDQTRICETLVHDQHLQQQGWAAVVANLEDITSAFRTRSELFEQNFLQHLGSREQFTQLLANFKEDLKILGKIPVLPVLLILEEREGDTSEPLSLLQWIAAKDHQNSLEQVAEQCIRGLEQFDQNVLDSLRRDIDAALQASSKADMKEIKGLEERLYGLEQLMFETRRIVQEQTDLAQAFSQNQVRANNLGDTSILPDLCNSHRRQLKVMLKNHEQLKDIRRRCTRAKEELSVNLYHRLRWIVYVENNICEVSNKLLIYHESLKRLRRRLDVVQQIHLAPQTYVRAVGEVVRRKTFSRTFLQWATELASQLEEIHREETTRRQAFKTQFEGHFLHSLFPGLNDVPPPFATKAPPEFDAALPELTTDDVANLKEQLPELASLLAESNDASLAHFFLTHSLRHTHTSQSQTEAADSSIGALLPPAETAAQPDLSPQPSLDVPSLPREDRGFESETDTEEFEKVGQSPIEPNAPSSEAPPCIIQTSDKSGSETNTLPSSSLLHQEEVGVSESSCHNLPPPPTNFLSSPMAPESGEFTTADFYIDESMPSSCVGSNDTSVAAAAAVVTTPHLELLQLRAESLEKDTLINLLQENLGGVRSEEERMRGLAKSVTQLAFMETRELSAQLVLLRELLAGQGKVLTETVENVHTTTVKQLTQHQHRHEETISRLEKVLSEREHDITMLREQLVRAEAMEGLLRAELEARHTKALESLGTRLREEGESELRRQLMETQAEAQARLDQALTTAEEEKQAAIKETTDKLSREHRLQIEVLRSRFRMVHASQMERSPSDTSLEKIERGDLIDAGQHEAALNKLRQEMATEQVAAVAEATARERRRLESELDRERTRLMRQEAAKQVAFNEALRRVAQDKDRQLEALREESEQLRTTVERLSQAQEAAERDLTEQRDTIRRLQQYQQQRSSRHRHVPSHDAMSTSVAVLAEPSANREPLSSPESSRRRLQEDSHLRDRLSRSTNTLIQQGMVSIASCNVGDTVLVLWDEELRNYTVLQESTTLYFLHSDCLDALGLPPLPSDGNPRKSYCIGQVAKKEYCFARKAGNRFGVPKDTKFYRLMVRPLQRDVHAQGQQTSRSSTGTSAGTSGMSSSQQLGRTELELDTLKPGNSSTL